MDSRYKGSDSPRVIRMSWGEITTEVGVFRDAKLWPGGGRNWDWSETGTDHRPGVQPADVSEVLDNGVHLVIIGQGQQERLEVMEDTIEIIRRQGAGVETLESTEAVIRYNEYVAAGKPVGALIHSTC